MQDSLDFVSIVCAGVMTLAIAVALPTDGVLVAMENDAEIAAFGKSSDQHCNNNIDA